MVNNGGIEKLWEIAEELRMDIDGEQHGKCL